jgi:hypothetical protein
VTVRTEVDAMIAELGDLPAHGRALAEAAQLLADDVDDPPSMVTGPRAITGYVAGLRATLAELAEVAAGKTERKVTVVDELAGKRQARIAGAADPVRATGRGKSGDG